VKFKETFGCLSGIGFKTNQGIETPLIQAGRPDRIKSDHVFLDPDIKVTKVKVRIFKEKDQVFITGI